MPGQVEQPCEVAKTDAGIDRVLIQRCMSTSFVDYSERPMGLSRGLQRCPEHWLGKQCGTCCLNDLLHERFKILQQSGPDSWTALSGCSTQLRYLIQQNARTVYVNDIDGVPALFRRNWHQLSLIIVCNQMFHDFVKLAPILLPETCCGLEAVRLTTVGSMLNAVALTVRPRPSLGQLQLACQPNQLPNAIAYMRLELHDHNRANCNPMASGVTSKLRWNTVEWRRSEAATFLAALQHLNLADTKLNSSALKPLSTGHWPCLQDSYVVYLHSGSDIGLHGLNMRGNNLESDTIANLVAAQLPSLSALDLSNNKLQAAAMKNLAKGKWPTLLDINLAHNALNDSAVLHLVPGHWRSLRILRLDGNIITDKGFRLLRSPHWSHLL